MRRADITRQHLVDAISRSLVEFGYPDATPEAIGEVYDAFKAGAREEALPHGIVGRFAERQILEAQAILKVLP